MRLPLHIGVIPDGNRRWAVGNGLSKEKGYDSGLNPGLELFKLCEGQKPKDWHLQRLVLMQSKCYQGKTQNF